MVLLTYKKDKRPPDMETAKMHLAQAMRKVREKYKKAGKKMRWMANIEVGTKGAWHIHFVIKEVGDTGCRHHHKGCLGAWSSNV